MARPATVRFYIDADVLGLAKLPVQIRPDVTYPGDPGGEVHKRRRPPCSIKKPSTLDEVWLPETAKQGWLVITRDRRIRERPAELAAVRENGVRMVALAASDAGGTWQQLEVLMSQWRAIEAKLEEAPPFIYSATRSGLRLEAL